MNQVKIHSNNQQPDDHFPMSLPEMTPVRRNTRVGRRKAAKLCYIHNRSFMQFIRECPSVGNDDPMDSNVLLDWLGLC